MMKLQIFSLMLFVTTTLSAQNFLSQIIPNFDKLTQPVINTVAVGRTDSSIQFNYHNLDFTITQSGELLRPFITVQRGQSVVERQLLNASPFFPDAECNIVSFDADKNGINDLFIVIPYGLTGRNANVDIIASFFFFPDSSFKYVCLRSYEGDTDLFREYNHDGRLEFACVNELESGATVYDAVNLFSVKNATFTNITKKTPGFPLFVEQTAAGPKVIPKLPPSLAASWFLKSPDVLSSTTQAIN